MPVVFMSRSVGHGKCGLKRILSKNNQVAAVSVWPAMGLDDVLCIQSN